ncbi:hypothetical protein GPJ56_003654 [Histomonas meleagridis]|uniref:uncharacterized protein n=1 Tax=Histomonas meleagridis TaxID=135588 RepID=UPI00355A46EC|nr:hypothetical protein GPJ56_003654 [Histomonas meleagridis]KAH0800725.1 hypothetical protein GO595_006478 [Histomonas meleagridis]
MEGNEWTEDEDFFLSQGYAIYHDDKQEVFDKIRRDFPFKQSRTSADLADRWRYLMDQLEAEDQDTIQRIKDGKFRPQTWTYSQEPRVQMPDVDQMIEQFRQMPSLAMKTQFAEIQTSKFSDDNQNINEVCLNYQFDVDSINKIVENVLKKTVDDETLRKTLQTEFQKSLAQKGREFSVEDISRRLNIINEMTDPNQSFTESKSMIGHFDKIFTGIRQKIQYNQQVAVTQDSFAILRILSTIQWPLSKTPNVDNIQKEFNRMYFGCFAEMFNRIRDPNSFQMYKLYIDFAISIDVNNDLEPLINPNLRPLFAKQRAAQVHQIL